MKKKKKKRNRMTMKLVKMLKVQVWVKKRKKKSNMGQIKSSCKFSTKQQTKSRPIPSKRAVASTKQLVVPQ